MSEKKDKEERKEKSIKEELEENQLKIEILAKPDGSIRWQASHPVNDGEFIAILEAIKNELITSGIAKEVFRRMQMKHELGVKGLIKQ